MNETHFCSLDAEHILSIPLSTLENAEGFVASLESFRNVAGAEKASLPENLNVIRSVEPSNVSHPTEFNNPSKTEGVVKSKFKRFDQHPFLNNHQLVSLLCRENCQDVAIQRSLISFCNAKVEGSNKTWRQRLHVRAPHRRVNSSKSI